MCPSGGIDRNTTLRFSVRRKSPTRGRAHGPGNRDKRKIEQLRRTDILKRATCSSPQNYAGKDEADIEDFFEPEVFVDIINRAYDLPAPHALSVAKLAGADPSTPRQVKRAEAAFRTMPEKHSGVRSLHSGILVDPQSKCAGWRRDTGRNTMERASAAFELLNALLSRSSAPHGTGRCPQRRSAAA